MVYRMVILVCILIQFGNFFFNFTIVTLINMWESLIYVDSLILLSSNENARKVNTVYSIDYDTMTKNYQTI